MSVRCDLGFSGEALAEYAGVGLKDYILDADAAYTVATEAPRIVAERFGIAIGPSLMGLSYHSLLPCGAEIDFMDNGNPTVHPCLTRLEDFQRWGEFRPFDHPTIRHLLAVWRTVDKRLGGGKLGFSYGNEAPFTAAVLLRGETFFEDILEQPALARAFLDRLTDHWLIAFRAVRKLAGAEPTGGFVWLGDDFSGLLSPAQFREFVLPTYRRIFTETRAVRRVLHAELLRPDHLPLLDGLELTVFDPHVDQYLTPDDLKTRLPAGIQWYWRVITSHLITHSPEELIAEYEEGVSAGPTAMQVAVMPGVPDANILAIKQVGEKYR
jgi:uroporphyrinogen-III decarboxylase